MILIRNDIVAPENGNYDDEDQADNCKALYHSFHFDQRCCGAPAERGFPRRLRAADG